MRILSIFLILLLIVGCSNTNIEEEIIQETSTSTSSSITPYNLYVTNTTYNLNKYEPSEKIYLGVYLKFNNNEKEVIESFENNVNSSHAIYSYELKLDEEFPLNFVLACYSKNKIPFISVNPPENSEDTFNIEMLKELAKSFGNLNIPIFINLYENPHLNNYNENEYLNFFKQAKIYFEMYAKNVALVWSVDSNSVYEVNKYYPGDNFVDWVGINIYETISKDNKIEKVLTELNYFYNNFQNNKPICISSLGISHFSNETLDYMIEEKISELDRYFNTIPIKYPRIKLINYLNYDNFQTSNNESINNFSITDNKKILNTYNKLTQNDIFIPTLNINTENNSSEELKKLNFLAYKQNDTLLINEDNIDIFMYNKKIDNFNKNDFELIKINNSNYYNLSEIAKYYKFELEINEDYKNLIIR